MDRYQEKHGFLVKELYLILMHLISFNTHYQELILFNGINMAQLFMFLLNILQLT